MGPLHFETAINLLLRPHWDGGREPDQRGTWIVSENAAVDTLRHPATGRTCVLRTILAMSEPAIGCQSLAPPKYIRLSLGSHAAEQTTFL